ncbi:hypothetical protein BXZ70DRAFT_942864 [Cristinia sonorae]|uniref:RNA polymerase II subunit A C-terminal domain phosphatase n=1 Tax=Cristinia sonorae TaxID=1940300 RepID=A0A8K0UN80_9AGAR|nr:hypothetical protein BXZ70DRAFT_942864 [Cristinia sonorae]
MSDPSDLYLPPHLPYPIKITAIAVPESADVQRGTRLLSYSFSYKGAEKSELRFGTWDSSIEGTVAKWNFNPGETISQRKAKDIPALAITEPCKHGMQLSGLCCLCGKDMTSFDYTGFSDASRASIQMTHSATGPTVSLEEAQRIERQTAEHLLQSRKLSLIVDLDQTIVHATVDPTVGEWITEGEAWEARNAKLKQNGGTNKDTIPLPDTRDEVNPNWEALKDVKKFRLGPEALGQTGKKGKDKSVENDGCMYYIKPRPGWFQFLSEVANKYEMHVYTMGTRAYAEEVCAAIDPDGKFFGGRILSRDESGSMTQKSLQRLFPCDQSMVVIIDDRADVWEWSPNLVKVIPYDFFVGIGDINSAFLPKIAPMTPELPPDAPHALKPPPEATPAEAIISSQLTELTDESLSLPGTALTIDDSLVFGENERSEIVKNEILTRNHEVLDQQVEERPLAKKQEELQVELAPTPGSSNGRTAKGSGPVVPTVKSTPRKALLKNDDIELTRVQNLLNEVHRRFFAFYDSRKGDSTLAKPKTPVRRPKTVDYDVRVIIPQLRQLTFEGIHILFSSVIPLDTRPESTEIWRTAIAFGAQCYTELNSRITHVVAAKRGTVKVDSARRQGGIKIVWVSWFTDSIAFWHRQDETPYLMDPEPTRAVGGPASPPSDAHQISSDPEPDADDWDEDARRVTTPIVTGDQELELDEVDWSAINDEVEAAMNESDEEEDGKSERSVRFGNVSEDEGSWTEETNSVTSANSTPRGKRKRLRSVTPSDGGRSTDGDRDVLRSPLAKRKKIVADRSGQSKLKEAFSAADFPEAEDGKQSKSSTPTSLDRMDEDDLDDEEEDDDDDDDFLARELGEDWG